MRSDDDLNNVVCRNRFENGVDSSDVYAFYRHLNRSLNQTNQIHCQKPSILISWTASFYVPPHRDEIWTSANAYDCYLTLFRPCVDSNDGAC